MSINDSILRATGLSDKNFEFLFDVDGNFNHFEYRNQDHHKVVMYEALLHGELSQCPLCGFSSQMIRHGFSKPTEIKLPTGNGFDNRMKLRKQRFHCFQCGGNPVVSSKDLIENSTISKPLKRQVIRLAMEDVSETVISFISRLSPMSVHRVINHELTDYHYDYSELPSVLSFDEIRIGHQYAFVYASPEGFGEILPSRDLSTIRKYFLGFSLEQRRQVTHIVVDMNASYQSVVKGLFPNAKVVIDRFHIIQLMTRAINTIRIGIQRLLNKKSRVYKIMKSGWRLFLKRFDKLEKAKRVYLRGLNEYIGEVEALSSVFDDYPVLESAYLTYQEALSAIENRDTSKLKQVIEDYQPIGSAMDMTVGTFRRNIKGILEALKVNWSNGKIEGINRRLKQIGRTAYGYRNLENYMRRIRIQMKYGRY